MFVTFVVLSFFTKVLQVTFHLCVKESLIYLCWTHLSHY